MNGRDRKFGFALALIGALCLPLAGPAGAAVKKAGVASVVLPQATGQPVHRDRRVLRLGIDMFVDERVETGAKGKTQILFMDGSALTIGPNSEITLDQFVYDSERKVGDLAFSTTKGVFRFVGGRISKRSPVTIRTPSATIGVRGGIATINVDGAVSATFLYGDAMTVEAGGQVQRVTRPGFRVAVPRAGAAPSPPRPVSQIEIAADLGGFERQPGDGTANDGESGNAGSGDNGRSGNRQGNGGQGNGGQANGRQGNQAQANGGPANNDQANNDQANNGRGGDNRNGGGQANAAPNGTGPNDGANAAGGPAGPGGSFEAMQGGDGERLMLADLGGAMSDGPAAAGDGRANGAGATGDLGMQVEQRLEQMEGGGMTGQFVGPAMTGPRGAGFGPGRGPGDGRGPNDGPRRGPGPDGRFGPDAGFGFFGPDPVFNGFASDGQQLLMLGDPALAGFVEFGFVGAAKRGNDPLIGTNDFNPGDNLGLFDFQIIGGVAIGSSIAGDFELFVPISPGVFPIGGGTGFEPSLIPSGLSSGTVTLSDRGGFVVYELAGNNTNNRVIAFAGRAATVFPTGGFSSFILESDFVRGGDLPFVDAIDAIEHPNLYIAWTDPQATQRPAAVGGGFAFVSGQASNQKSAGALFVGSVLGGEFGQPHMQGQHRGISRTSNLGTAVFSDGAFATADAIDGTDFFGDGAIEGFVLEAAEVSEQDDVISRGVRRIQNGASSTIFPNAPAFAEPLGAVGQVRSTREINGFAAGLIQRVSAGSVIANVGFDSGPNSDNVRIFTDAGLNVVDAAFQLSADTLIDLEFGEVAPNGFSAFIDDDTFFASGDSVFVSGETTLASNLFLLSSAVFHHQGFMPAGVSFCACQFLKWGFFGGSVVTGASPNIHVQLSNWVAGPLSSTTQLVGLPNQTATYTGHLIGAVDNVGRVYHAVGGIELEFDFGPGNYSLQRVDITSFDGANLTSSITSTPNGFPSNSYDSSTAGLTISGSHPGVGAVTATINGAFYGPGTPPGDTGGQFAINGANYAARGIYAATGP